MLENAIKLVFKAHRGQVRRNDDIEFAYHPIAVAMMLQANGCNEEIVITGLLHDIIEDTSYDYEYLKEHYGSRIADNVLMLSEDKSIKNFRERKEKFFNKIEYVSNDLILIELFDKIHNLESDYDTYQKEGMDMYQRSNSTYEDIKWFYLEFRNIFRERIKNKTLLRRYEELIKYYFKKV